MKITSETKERSCNNSPHAESKPQAVHPDCLRQRDITTRYLISYIHDESDEIGPCHLPQRRNIFRSFCTELRKFLNFQMSEEKKLASEQELCLWAADAGHNFFV